LGEKPCPAQPCPTLLFQFQFRGSNVSLELVHKLLRTFRSVFDSSSTLRNIFRQTNLKIILWTLSVPTTSKPTSSIRLMHSIWWREPQISGLDSKSFSKTLTTSWYQFYQRFSHMFFVQIFGAKLRFSLVPKICTKNASNKHWWNWLQVSSLLTFYKQLLSAKIPKVQKDTDDLHFWDLCA